MALPKPPKPLMYPDGKGGFAPFKGDPNATTMIEDLNTYYYDLHNSKPKQCKSDCIWCVWEKPK